MPTFTYENSAASNSGVILLEVPDVAWFKDSVMSAIAEMCIPENWFGDDPDYEKYAVLQANLMQATYKVLNFNPFPVGMVIAYSNSTPPPGYLLCDGSEYTQTEYPELFSAIGDEFKYDEIYFQTPDLRQRFINGFDDEVPVNTRTDNNYYNLNDAQLPSHTHTDNGHYHGIQLTTDGLAVAPGELPVVVPIPIVPGSTDIGYADLTYTGDNASVDNKPSFVALNYIIYAGR